MKKLTFLAAAFVAVSIVACGPSKAELEAAEKAKQDSLAAVAKADSLAAAEAAAAEAEKAKADSLAAAMKADSIAKAEEATKAHHTAHHTTTKPGQIDITKKPGAGETKIDITKKPGASH